MVLINIFSKVSLTCIPFAVFILSQYDENSTLWKIGICAPIIGAFLAFGSNTRTQIVLLTLCNIGFYFIWIIFLFLAEPMTPPSGPTYWERYPRE
ncbi:hypothetical protein GCM10007140_05670 [Priestia taiwanensis]|uniref:Uncharacterized protein n=1 Tax=Priestia taiwanensis TaxID=1347902 RepID=A0A917AKH5_9BACI|nr:hypothetical protein GCM10007140_05670 [Priestia taiwanensis]